MGSKRTGARVEQVGRSRVTEDPARKFVLAGLPEPRTRLCGPPLIASLPSTGALHYRNTLRSPSVETKGPRLDHM